jgi:hypothetical protein
MRPLLLKRGSTSRLLSGVLRIRRPRGLRQPSHSEGVGASRCKLGAASLHGPHRHRPQQRHRDPGAARRRCPGDRPSCPGQHTGSKRPKSLGSSMTRPTCVKGGCCDLLVRVGAICGWREAAALRREGRRGSHRRARGPRAHRRISILASPLATDRPRAHRHPGPYPRRVVRSATNNVLKAAHLKTGRLGATARPSVLSL